MSTGMATAPAVIQDVKSSGVQAREVLANILLKLDDVDLVMADFNDLSRLYHALMIYLNHIDGIEAYSNKILGFLRIYLVSSEMWRWTMQLPGSVFLFLIIVHIIIII
jgi:hypothetical protein